MTKSQHDHKLQNIFGGTLNSSNSSVVLQEGKIPNSNGSIYKTWVYLYLFSSFTPPAGTYSHQAAGIALHPHEWRSAKQPRSTTPPPGRRKNYPFSDGGFSEDDWDRPPGQDGAQFYLLKYRSCVLCASADNLTIKCMLSNFRCFCLIPLVCLTSHWFPIIFCIA